MKDQSTQIAKWLLQINAIKLSPQNPFTWASGIKSPIYCDNRITLSYPDIRRGVIQGFSERAEEFKPFDAIAGVATAGIPHGALLAEKLSLPFLYVRSKPKAHGRQNQIEGKLETGQRILMIEDLISTGGSSLQAVEAVREAGGVVVGVLAIFSYGFDKARTAFEAADCPFATLSDYDTLLDIAVKQEYITADQLETLKSWRLAPAEWGV
ncbi:MAG: orotate phosphoribosyltransferase [Bacteroidota bacterium]